MKPVKMAVISCSVFFLFLLSVSSGFAHFGMVIPSDNMLMQGEPREVNIMLSFSHPFEMIGMTLEKPDEFFMILDGSKKDLKAVLKESKLMGHKAWEADYMVKRPGAHSFVMIPAPYWEPAEDCFIVHYTKTVVAAFGGDEGWDVELGLKTEIVPLAKPFGLYAANVFQGIVKLDGKPVPYAEVEVEYYNKDKQLSAPSDYMVTQTIKADGSGIFTYAAPRTGWWGFAALSTSDQSIKKDGEEKDVELGAVIWVKFENLKE
jgi:cobalt/nickel transport protein